MAVSESTKRWFVITALVYIFALSCKFGKAYDEYPHLGAAGVVANEYLPKAEAEVEGETNQYFPEAGIIGTGPAYIFNKALGCLSDKHIYSSCDEVHRLTQVGELNVEPEYTDEYCKGPCIDETHHVLDCIEGILKHFIFYNKATVKDIRETIESGCSYGPKRGNFNVLEHIKADGASASKVFNPVLYGIMLVMTVLIHV